MANPLLALQVQPPNIDVAGSLGRGQELRTLSLANTLNEYKMKQAQAADENALAKASLYHEIGPGLASGEDAAINRLAQIDPEAAQGFRKEALGQKKTTAEIGKFGADTAKTELETAFNRAEFVSNGAQALLQVPAAARPLVYERLKQFAGEQGGGIKLPDALPNYDDATLKAIAGQAISAKDQIAAAQKAAADAETARSNRADEENTRRGQNMTDARARQTTSEQKYRLMTPEEKKASGLPESAAYQVNANGQITRVAGNTSVRPIPSSALQGIQSNRRTLDKIDKAIAAIEKNPEALSWSNAIPGMDAINQRIPTKGGAGGVTTRALVADIGSQKLHDRSGAAVTASETPRLVPFIPSVSDTPEAAIEKLRNLRAEYEASADETEAFYSPEAGYMELPSRGKGAKPGSSGGKPVSGVIDFNDLPD